MVVPVGGCCLVSAGDGVLADSIAALKVTSRYRQTGATCAGAQRLKSGLGGSSSAAVTRTSFKSDGNGSDSLAQDLASATFRVDLGVGMVSCRFVVGGCQNCALADAVS